jgi:hypothetical protein
MRAGDGRAGGLTDVVCSLLERWQDHPNTGKWGKKKKKTASEVRDVELLCKSSVKFDCPSFCLGWS